MITPGMKATPPRELPGKTAYINAHLVDPANGLDEIGALLSDGESIADVVPDLFRGGSGWS
ncbi:MAG: hypothetical protein HOC63_06950, partial [Rhodospirillales bacterium]|nr:hypothetical protein [Rhodospirillales bacterium]